MCTGFKAQLTLLDLPVTYKEGIPERVGVCQIFENDLALGEGGLLLPLAKSFWLSARL